MIWFELVDGRMTGKSIVVYGKLPIEDIDLHGVEALHAYARIGGANFAKKARNKNHFGTKRIICHEAKYTITPLRKSDVWLCFSGIPILPDHRLIICETVGIGALVPKKTKEPNWIDAAESVMRRYCALREDRRLV